MQTVNGIPRRRRVDLYTPAETAIRNAIIAVEAAGADVRLTDAVMLLSQAAEKVADYVERENPDIALSYSVEAPKRTIADDIAAYKATSPEDKRIINQLVGKLIDLSCPHCGKGIPTTIET